MVRSLALAAALLFSSSALACPMADAAAFTEAAAKVEQASGAKATFAVTGMHCGSCSEKVSKALIAVPGVTAAAVDYQTGRVVVAYDAQKANKAAMLEAITKSGFKATEATKS